MSVKRWAIVHSALYPLTYTTSLYNQDHAHTKSITLSSSSKLQKEHIFLPLHTLSSFSLPYPMHKFISIAPVDSIIVLIQLIQSEG